MNTLDWQQIIKDYPPVPEDQQVAMIMSGDPEKINRVALGFMKLVVQIANRYVKNPADLADYIQEGYLGIIKNIRKYDPSRGAKPITYLTNWILERIRRQKYHNKLIKIPAETWRMVYKFKKLEQELSEGGIIPHFEEIVKKMDLTEKKIARLWKALQQPVSMNTKTTTEEGDEWDHASKYNLEEDIIHKEEEFILESRIKYRLTTDEKIVLKLKQNGMTKKEIAQKMNITVPKVIKLEQNIMLMLKS